MLLCACMTLVVLFTQLYQQHQTDFRANMNWIIILNLSRLNVSYLIIFSASVCCSVTLHKSTINWPWRTLGGPLQLRSLSSSSPPQQTSSRSADLNPPRAPRDDSQLLTQLALFPRALKLCCHMWVRAPTGSVKGNEKCLGAFVNKTFLKWD